VVTEEEIALIQKMAEIVPIEDANPNKKGNMLSVFHHPKNKSLGRWTDEEHIKFIKAIRLFGKDWRRVQEFIGTRSGAQIRSHA